MKSGIHKFRRIHSNFFTYMFGWAQNTAGQLIYIRVIMKKVKTCQ